MKNQSTALVDIQCDVAVVGGGIAGLSMALSLHKAGLKVVLIDQSSLVMEKDCGQATRLSNLGYDIRVCAINNASKQLFESLAVWDLMVTENQVSAFSGMQVWEKEGTGSIEFDAASIDLDDLGYIVENSVMRSALLNVLAQTSVQQLPDVSVVDITQNLDAIQCRLKDGRLIEAAILIGADGAQSTVSQLVNIPTREWDYPHQALVTTVKTEQAHGHIARQIFLESGPLAFLPLHGDGHVCSIVWSADPDTVRHLKDLPERVFCTEIGKAFEYRLGKITEVDSRQIMVLRQRHGKDYYRGRAVLVGDAAHTIHPLAGQGLNLGLADVAALSEVLEKQYKRCKENSALLGIESVITRYQRKRQGKNLFMMTAMEGLYRLFAGQNMSVRWLRNAGLRRTNRLLGVKKLLIKTAMGV